MGALFAARACPHPNPPRKRGREQKRARTLPAGGEGARAAHPSTLRQTVGIRVRAAITKNPANPHHVYIGAAQRRNATFCGYLISWMPKPRMQA
ncbi:hypothetical protein MASR1M8_08090 [Thermomonas brevis]